jgi:PAS domain S-box-containing protein
LLRRLCRYLSERSPQPMVAVEGTTHNVIYLNSAFARLVGRERNDLIGRPFAEAVPEGHANGCLALLDRVYCTGTPENLAEQEHSHAQACRVYWSYAVWAILGPDEQPAGVMIQVTDSTETALFRQQAVAMNEALIVSATQQHELAEVARSLSKQLEADIQARDRFVAVLSHELRNPLAAIRTGLQLVRLDGDDPITMQESSTLLDMMERQVKQLVWLLEDLLDLSRITTGKLDLRKERLDLAAVLRDAVEASRPLIDRGGHELSVSLPSDPILLNADSTRLTQVFLNLLTNAAKYSERGGQIRLSVEREGNEVVVSLKDTGVGISDFHLPHIFDVFMQVDPTWHQAQGGLGIGLSLVKEFVELHGGRVEAHSEGLGKGSEFIVRLPADLEVKVAEPTPTAAEKSRGPRRRILVVDDNTDAAETLARFLRIMGHEVRTAYDGELAVEGVATFRPEVIVMDIGMPNVDGYEAARRIRAHAVGKETFLVALTGWGADNARQQIHEAGFDHHLVKPVDPDILTRVIAEIPMDRFDPS